jgi:hypothetical protein
MDVSGNKRIQDKQLVGSRPADNTGEEKHQKPDPPPGSQARKGRKAGEGRDFRVCHGRAWRMRASGRTCRPPTTEKNIISTQVGETHRFCPPVVLFLATSRSPQLSFFLHLDFTIILILVCIILLFSISPVCFPPFAVPPRWLTHDLSPL